MSKTSKFFEFLEEGKRDKMYEYDPKYSKFKEVLENLKILKGLVAAFNALFFICFVLLIIIGAVLYIANISVASQRCFIVSGVSFVLYVASSYGHFRSTKLEEKVKNKFKEQYP